MPSFLSAYLTKLEVEKLQKLVNTEFDIIWNFDSSRFFNLKLFKTKYRIAHLVDYFENFNRDTLCKHADLCLCTSEFIACEMRKFNKRVYNIGHGYQMEREELSMEELTEIKNLPFSIKVGYVGNLTIKYLDWETIYALTDSHPDIGFYFIGPEGKSNVSKSSDTDRFLDLTKQKANVFFLGAKEAQKIPAYLKKMDILLLIYKAGEYKEQLANPHKVLEYLGSGKTILASWTEEYKNNQGLLEMEKDSMGIVRRFHEVVKNLVFFNHADKQAQRVEFAAANTYEMKIEQIEALIET